jgi:putative lipoic acid-binding regulatory protein
VSAGYGERPEDRPRGFPADDSPSEWTGDLSGRRLELASPCPWTYVLIGRSEALLQAAVRDLLGGRDYVLAPSNRSARGRWVSLSLELTVASEDQRRGLFAALRGHADVRFVL